MNDLVSALVMGVGATVLVDLWAIARRRACNIPLPDYGLVGRWFAHLARGRFRHESIAASAAVHGERVIGWIAHYVIGVLFAALLLAVWGLAWVRHPMIGRPAACRVGSCLGSTSDDRPGTARRHRNRAGTLPDDATRHGRHRVRLVARVTG